MQPRARKAACTLQFKRCARNPKQLAEWKAEQKAKAKAKAEAEAPRKAKVNASEAINAGKRPLHIFCARNMRGDTILRKNGIKQGPWKLLNGQKFRAAKVLFKGSHYLAKAGPCTLTESEGRWLVQWLRWKKKCYVTNSVLTKDIIFEGDPRYETTPAEHYP